MMSNRWRRRAAIVVASLLLVAAVRADDDDEEEPGSALPPSETRARVRIEEAHAGEMPVRLHAIGTVAPLPQEEASLVSLAGGVVAKVLVPDGQRVDADTPIVLLDDRPMKEASAKSDAALRTVQGELARAREFGLDAQQAELDLAASQSGLAATQARREADRQQGLLADQLASEKAATEAAQAADAAERAARVASDKARWFREKGRASELARIEAAVDAAKADAQTAGRLLAAATITARRAGRVSGLSVSVGQMIEPGCVVATVVGDSGLAVRLGLAPRDADEVLVGAKASLSGSERTGCVCSIGGGVDPDTGLVPVTIALDPAATGPRIGEAVFVDVDVSAPAKGILVPVSALLPAEGGSRVYVVDGGDLAHATDVIVLARDVATAVVEGEGISEGTRVIVDGHYNLPDGARVVPEPKR